MKRLLIGLVLFSMGSAFAASAEVEAAMAKGVRFLLAKQAPEGHWSDAQMPALSALPVWAIAACGGEMEKGKWKIENEELKMSLSLREFRPRCDRLCAKRII